MGLLIVSTSFIWYVVFCENRSGLAVYFLDVGQGDATFIQAKNGKQVLLDGGENKNVLRQLAEIMPFYDRSIDVLMLSHAHNDHLGGLIEVLKRFKVNLVVEACLDFNTSEYIEWKNLIKDKKIARICAQKGQKINLGPPAGEAGDDLYFDVLLPVGEVAGRKIHDAMLVTRLIYGDDSFLFAGDMGKNLENYLAQVYDNDLRSTVLKVGHHGSDTSTSEIFLGYVSPKTAVISVGEDNKFGHPHQEVLDRLEKFGVSVLRTDEEGIVSFKIIN